MGWSYGFVNGRDVGYGVPAECDYSNCHEKIDRGLSYICGGDVAGGEHGCGLFFCSEHLHYTELDNEYGEPAPQLCMPCLINFRLGSDNYKLFAACYEPKPDVPKWLRWKLKDASWAQWRKENPDEVASIKARLSHG